MRILLIAYYFPPGVDGGGQRPEAFQKHLNRLGHPTAVLTHTYKRFCRNEENEFRIFDPSFCRDHRGRRFIPWALRRGLVLAANLLGRPRTIFSAWKKSALQALPEIIKDFQPDVLIASYPPVETLELGLAAARLGGLPLVADFRDGLLFEPIDVVNLGRHTCLRDHYTQVEKEISATAFMILTVSEPISVYFRKKYSHPRVHTLPNGFDPADFQTNPKAAFNKDGKITIIHTGSLSLSDPTVDITPFISALLSLAAKHPEIGKRLKLEFAGRLHPAEKRAIKTLSSSFPVKTHSFLSRTESLLLQQRSDLLLLITSSIRLSVTTGKIFEYLAAGKPILALTPQHSAAAELIRRTGCGWTVEPDDEAGLSALLARLMSDPAMISELQRNENEIKLYQRPRQVAGLAKMLQALLVGKADLSS